jgi:inosine-uridine nucleoside N-ribohydrolase
MTVQLPLIIDTDPGVDDALAIMLAVFSDTPIRALTTVYGNVSVEQTTNNTLYILSQCNKNIPVYCGADKPLKGSGKRAQSHGTDGLGGCSKQTDARPQTMSAGTYYASIDRPFRLACLGPTTNIALAVEQSTAIQTYAQDIVVLGGAFSEKGNTTPYAEFNVYQDPYALDCLLKNNLPLVLIPIELCRKVVFTTEDFAQIKDFRMRQILEDITKSFIQYYTSDPLYGAFSGGVMYDLLVIAYFLNPNFFTLEETCITVCTEKNNYFGQTRYEKNAQPNCRVATGVDAQKVKQLFFDTLNARSKLNSV